MDISKIDSILLASKKANDNILMTGLHGIGKSEKVFDYCNENNFYYSPLFLSQMEVGDIIGLPTNINGVMHWSRPYWLEEMRKKYWPDTEIDSLIFEDDEDNKFKNYLKDRNGKNKKITAENLSSFYNDFYCTNIDVVTDLSKVKNPKGIECVSFLDEYSRAPVDVKNATMQLLLEKRIHEHKLPLNTQIIGADNPGDGDYFVQDMDPAQLDRWLYIEVEANPKSWLKWARNKGINKIVIDYITDNQSKLQFTPEDGDKIDATPRSWSKLASYVDNFDNIPEDMHFYIIKGKIGSALGSEFYLFYRNYSSNISLEDIKYFIDKEYKKEKDFNNLGNNLKKYLSDMENITKLEYINNIFMYSQNIIKDDNSTMDDLIYLFTFLYSLEIETLTSFLKDKKENNPELFYLLMSKDEDRKLANKIKSKISGKVKAKG